MDTTLTEALRSAAHRGPLFERRTSRRALFEFSALKEFFCCVSHHEVVRDNPDAYLPRGVPVDNRDHQRAWVKPGVRDEERRSGLLDAAGVERAVRLARLASGKGGI
ncbi:putative Px [Rottboellia yellow mottle virus]|uniref:Putative Px n=1 Tax=Rottboellia yellow mottle virus TaxID=1432563 RepID=A0A0E3ISH8_9VIRU|nr:putative Px [Rottboellia yellow mottle virus]AJG42067.1 putative Px [Rottboellia yellow mottle virus]WJJ45742.1 Px [Rottboellia yellow mottle virus]